MTRSEITKAAITYLGLKITRPLSSGGNILTHCPFHTDKTPSLSINVDEGLFHCFSCQRGGSIEKLFKEQVGESLYKTQGIRSDEFSSFANQTRNEVIPSLDDLDREITVQLSGDLIDYRASREAVAYLRRRGISFKVADAMKFRFAETLFANHTKYTNRLIIPIYEKGKMISLEGRDVRGDQKPKVLYPKDSTVNSLYELDSLDQTKRLYVVEGLMDLALLREYPEFKNSTSVFGAALTRRQLHLLSKFSEVVYIPDNDDAGEGTLATLRKNPQINANVLRVPAILNEHAIKDVGDIIAKARIPLSDLLKRKWLSKIKPLI